MASDSTLVLETSGNQASWAYFSAGEYAGGEALPQNQRRISQSLIPSLKSSGVELSTLTNILVGVGPGSFSGIRVAIAAGQGLARASGAELIPVRSTHAVGFGLDQVTFLGVFADARRHTFFFTAYEHGKMTRPSAVYPIAQLETMLSKCSRAVSTDGLAGVPEKVVPTAEGLYRAFCTYGVEPELALEPVYLHPAVG